VLTDVGGFSEVAALGAARLVAPGDRGALRDALAALIADPAARARLGAAALAAARGPYSWDEAARQTLALYQRLV
jgi:D-inositol-3-phosphate glycosyltransferase